MSHVPWHLSALRAHTTKPACICFLFVWDMVHGPMSVCINKARGSLSRTYFFFQKASKRSAIRRKPEMEEKETRDGGIILFYKREEEAF